MDLSLSELWEIVKGREPGVVQSMGLQRLRHNSATEQEEEESALLHRELYSIFYNGVYEKRIFFKEGWIYVYSLYIWGVHIRYRLIMLYSRSLLSVYFVYSSVYSLGFPGGSDGKKSTCNAEDAGLIPGWGRSPG